MIPKPGKKLAIENLGPISLASCFGKVCERTINSRLQNHLGDNKHLSDTMFDAGLSSQDVLLQIKEEILSNVPRNGEHVLLT